jgi:hypothetical protein
MHLRTRTLCAADGPGCPGLLRRVAKEIKFNSPERATYLPRPTPGSLSRRLNLFLSLSFPIYPSLRLPSTTAAHYLSPTVRPSARPPARAHTTF